MKLAYLPQKRRWNFDAASFIAKHDVVFRAPVCDPLSGIPIGDGETGCLLWLSEDTLHIGINRTDLWDDSTLDGGITCSKEEENLTVDRHGARIDLGFGCPVFGNIYQKEYEARLSLPDAAASVRAVTPFRSAEITAFSSHAAGVAVVGVEAESGEELPLCVTAQRWGSRTFWYWYSQYRDSPEAGLGGTNTSFGGDCMYVVQHLNGTDFCVAMKFGTEAEHAFETAGSHAVQCRFRPAKTIRFTAYLTAAVGSSPEDARARAERLVEAAAAQGRESLYAGHCREWSEFWSRSFVSLPPEQDYLENLWYLNLYYANCEMRGNYPPHFCNGIWNFSRDFVPWNYFFHYNMQLSTFPLDACGHPELLETYFDFRSRQLPYSEAYARQIKHSRGAFYADVCDRRGRNDAAVSDNCTCASQIAVGMYRHYLYTGDGEFLQKKALPVLRAAGEYYLDRLVPGEDGFFHIRATQGYEGSPLMDDSITDLSMIRCLFGILAEILPPEDGAVYAGRLGKLPPYRLMPFEDDEVKDGKFLCGVGKGKKTRGDSVLSVGKKCGGDWLRRTYGRAVHEYYGFPDTEMAPLFPAGIVGLGDRGTQLFNLICNSAYLHHETIPPDAEGADPSCGMCMGWCMEPIYLARLGLAEELKKQLEQTVKTWMIFPQGFGIYGPYDVFTGDNRLRWKKNRIRNVDTGETVSVPAWDFRHFDYETLPILATAVNEMLLQSFDGTLRLFPAVPADYDAQFCLTASGGFVVNAAYCRGEFDVFTESLRGNPCRLAFPESAAKPEFFDALTGEKLEPACEGGVYFPALPKGGCVRAVTPGALRDGVCAERSFGRNRDCKVYGPVKLGEEKGY